MNSARAAFCLSITTVALLAANWQVRVRGSRLAAAQEGGAAGNGTSLSAPQVSSTNGPAATSATLASNRRVETAEASAGLPQRSFPFDWSSVETTDYKQYAENLRAIGLPEELVRSIVIADIDSHYAPNEQTLQKQQIVHDASWTERQGTYETNEWDRIMQLRDVEIAKQTATMNVLGVYVPRPIVRTPRGANYEAYEYAIGLLPEEKRLAVQSIVEEEIIRDGMNHDRPPPHLEPVETYRVLAAERQAGLNQVLTPAEFELYERNTTPCGTELARQVIGMEPTEQEFATMFRLAYRCWQDSGGVYGWWRAIPVPSQQIDAAQQQLQTDLQAALGPDRYLDYQMAASGTGQQLQALAARYDLPRETLTRAFDLQRQIDWLDKGPASVREVGNGLIPPPTTPTDRARDALEQELQQVLGASVWQAWQDGRNRQVTFDPLK